MKVFCGCGWTDSERKSSQYLSPVEDVEIIRIIVIYAQHRMD
jgi:hypothetical protein